MNNLNYSNPSKVLLTLNIVFLALLSGQVFYFIIGLFLIQSGNGKGIAQMNNIFMFTVPIINLSAILAAKFIYEKNLAKFDKTLSFDNKVQSYQTNNVIKLALLEGTNIINISAMIITINYFFAALFVIIIALYFLNRPTKEKFIMEYELTAEDVTKILG